MTVRSKPKQLTLVFLAFLTTGSFAGWHVATWPTRLRYPGEENFVEGMRLAEMVHLRRHVPIYAPASTERFDAAIYGPLYYLLGARLINPERPAYFPLRFLSLLGTLGCALGSGILAFWLTGRRLAAVLAPLLFLGYGFVTSYGTSARSDSVALFLFFSAFLISYRLRNSKALLLSVPFVLLGLFYKQQFVAGPLAVLVFLLLERRYRLAIWYGGLLALGGLGLLAVFQFGLFADQAFLTHFLVYNLLPFSRLSLGLGLLFVGLMILVPLFAGLEFLRLHPSRLLQCYLACALILSVLTVAKEGSDANYFLEVVLVLSSLFAALVTERLATDAKELLALLGVSLFLGQWFSMPSPRPRDFVQDREVQDFLRENFPPRTRALGYHAGHLVRAGLETPISDLYQYVQLVGEGILSDHSLLTQLRECRFGIVLVSFDLRTSRETERTNNYLTEPLKQAILDNYRLAFTLDMPDPEKLTDQDLFYVWVPHKPSGRGP